MEEMIGAMIALEFLLECLMKYDQTQRPKYIFLENVKHFYGSNMHRRLLDTLHKCGHTWRQYMLSPMQIGIPNHRTRFYLAATTAATTPTTKTMIDVDNAAVPHQGPNIITREQCTHLITIPPGLDANQIPPPSSNTTPATPEDDEEDEHRRTLTQPDGPSTQENTAAAGRLASAETSSAPTSPEPSSSPSSSDPGSIQNVHFPALPDVSTLPILIQPRPLSCFLDGPNQLPPALVNALRVPFDVLQRGYKLSVVSPLDRRTFCFTGSYGHVINKSSGSLLVGDGPIVENGIALTDHPLDTSPGPHGEPYLTRLYPHLRFFSPNELLRMFGFPPCYSFPPHFRIRHAYKLIGNSINIGIVSSILKEELKVEWTAKDMYMHEGE